MIISYFQIGRMKKIQETLPLIKSQEELIGIGTSIHNTKSYNRWFLIPLCLIVWGSLKKEQLKANSILRLSNH